ncbi:MAG: hypothetical protein R3313_02600 [Candidatus Saccharimonadales bacterium]|nr:hypothetical protein [Candidatus Saccharimonadales bacterium]
MPGLGLQQLQRHLVLSVRQATQGRREDYRKDCLLQQLQKQEGNRMNKTTTTNSMVIDPTVETEWGYGQLVVTDADLLICPEANETQQLDRLFQILTLQATGKYSPVYRIVTGYYPDDAVRRLHKLFQRFVRWYEQAVFTVDGIAEYIGADGETEIRRDDMGFDDFDQDTLEFRVFTAEFWDTEDPAAADWTELLNELGLIDFAPTGPVTLDMLHEILEAHADPDNPVVLVTPADNEDGFIATLYGIKPEEASE